MKFSPRVALALLAFLVLLFVAGGVFLACSARQILVERAGALVGHRVTLESLRVAFPSTLELQGVQVKDIFVSPRVRLRVDLGLLLRRQLVFSLIEIEHPVVFLERTPEAELVFPPPGEFRAVSLPVSSSSWPVFGKSGSVRRLVVHEGELHLRDQKSKSEWILSAVNARVNDLPLASADLRTSFAASASLAGMNFPFLGQFVKLSGWVNVLKKDADADLQTVDDNGHECLDVRLVGQANDLFVSGKIRLNGKQQKQSSAPRAGLVEDMVLSLLEASETEIEADISFATRLDRFEVGPVKFKGKVKTGLQSDGSSGNIVDALKELGAALLKDDASRQVSP